ncbi:hypothetical protein M3221_20405 [Domibacillus indicus]|uniref:hypothetical protein n=1 Tax=Domibacillus indicus TaxID=1437523 RepID=UPI00203D46D2|nr:hypothetical protein [Domibacillus indicus]MCM3790714.1 hypothetical protein [Domibacillus indicus]
MCSKRIKSTFEGLRKKKTVAASTLGEYHVMNGTLGLGATVAIGKKFDWSRSTEGVLTHDKPI